MQSNYTLYLIPIFPEIHQLGCPFTDDGTVVLYPEHMFQETAGLGKDGQETSCSDRVVEVLFSIRRKVDYVG